MKKVFVLFCILFCSLFLFAESSSEYYPYTRHYNKELEKIFSVSGQKALMGDLTELDKIVSFDLAKLRNKDLRFLRNMVYAKYGNIFEAEDLTKFFSSFEWYKPLKKVSDSELTEKEKYLIERILSFEKRNENLKIAVTPAQLIGFWQRGNPFVASGYSAGFVFMNENEAFYCGDEMDSLKVLDFYHGTYKIAGNVLIFSVNEICYYEAFPDYEEWTREWRMQEWGNGSYKNTIKLCNPIEFKFPISDVYEKKIEYGDYKNSRHTVKIGFSEYFRILENPDKYFNYN